MALRFDNAADYLKTLVEPARPFSVMGWAKFSVDRNDYSTICMYDHGDPGTNDGAQGGVVTESGGLDPGFWDGAGFHDNTAITVGTWFFWAYTINATGTGAVTFHLRTSPTAAISTFSGWSMNSDTQDRLLVGNDSFSSFLNGCIDCVKVYDSVLTAAQLDQESRVRVPVFGPAHIWSPMVDSTVANAALDYSGNGRNWTVAGTLAVEDGAPIPWGAPAIIVNSAAAGAATQDISPDSITSLEAHGSPTLTTGVVTVAPSSIASLEAHGSPTLTVGAVTVSPESVASAEAFGSPSLTLYLLPDPVASAEAFGSPTLTAGAVDIAPDSITSLEAFGEPAVGQALAPSSIDSAESFGSPQLNMSIAPDSVGTAEAFGEPAVAIEAQEVAPSSITSLEAHGAPQLNLIIYPDGLASAEEIPAPLVDDGTGSGSSGSLYQRRKSRFLRRSQTP